MSPNPGRFERAAGEASTIEEKDCVEWSGAERKREGVREVREHRREN